MQSGGGNFETSPGARFRLVAIIDGGPAVRTGSNTRRQPMFSAADVKGPFEVLSYFIGRRGRRHLRRW